MVHTGLAQIRKEPPALLTGNRVGLLVHPASVDRDLVHARTIFAEICGPRLTALFGPQHGIQGDRQDNMVESPHTEDRELGIPVFSLYAETRRPTAEMLERIDLLAIDLQDVGTRVYTYITTMAYCMLAARDAGIRVLVLDRPNPIGGIEIEGNLLQPEYVSFVGVHPMPMRHGLTIGETAQFLNREMGIGCDLTVVPMRGWHRRMRFEQTGLPWVLPSPNLPTLETARIYPGQVLLEGTNLSEGRGTTRPFEFFGAPYLDTAALGRELREADLPGVLFREHHFLPAFQKWQGETCRGFQIHVTDPATYRPYRTALALLRAVLRLHPDRFAWRNPPYEYEEERLPIDLLIGDSAVRKDLEAQRPLREIEAGWREELERFRERRREYLLYQEDSGS